MNRGTYTIILLITGLLLGSLATITTSVVPTRIQVVSNEDAQVKVNNSATPTTSNAVIPGKSMLPIHQENGRFYFSDTLSMDNLVETSDETNRIKGGFNITLTKDVENAKLKVVMEASGDDEVNNALRAKLDIGQETTVLSLDHNEYVFNVRLSTTQVQQMFYNIFYELEDESCTIENLNNAEGSDITLKLYAYVE